LIHQRDLERLLALAEDFFERGEREVVFEWVEAELGDCGALPQLAGGRIVDEPEHARVLKVDDGVVVEVEAGAAPLHGLVGGALQKLPRHAEVADEAQLVVERDDQVLPAAAELGELAFQGVEDAEV
jgi:hypothetical protein